jgi:hypothetical protein
MRTDNILFQVVLVLLLLGTSSLKAQENDLLYVWAKSGLIVRDAPSIDGKRIGKLAYGDSIRIEEETEFRYLMKVLEIKEKKQKHFK